MNIRSTNISNYWLPRESHLRASSPRSRSEYWWNWQLRERKNVQNLFGGSAFEVLLVPENSRQLREGGVHISLSLACLFACFMYYFLTYLILGLYCYYLLLFIHLCILCIFPQLLFIYCFMLYIYIYIYIYILFYCLFSTCWFCFY